MTTGYRLPAGYRTNPPASSDGEVPYWDEAERPGDDRLQVPVYRWAAELAAAPSVTTVVDVGCGTAAKLVAHVGPRARVVGVDQGSGIAQARHRFPGTDLVEGDLGDPATWSAAAAHRPDLVICIDVVEHLAEPDVLLGRLRDLAGSGRLLLSTPDRDRLDAAPPLGPPRNPRHVREWTEPEIVALLQDCGLVVDEVRHLLPRTYAPTVAEARRALGRLRRCWPLPDARSNLALLTHPA